MLKTFRFLTSILVMAGIVPNLIFRAMDMNGFHQVGATIVVTIVVVAAVFAPFDEKDF